MKRKLSDWSAFGEKPPSVGVWETHVVNDQIIGGLYNYWNGDGYGLSELSPYMAYQSRTIQPEFNLRECRFRGLAEKPE